LAHIFLNLRKFGLKPTLPFRQMPGDFVSHAKASLGRLVAQIRTRQFPAISWPARTTGLNVKPEALSRWLMVLLVLLASGIGVYWLMKIIQVPFPAPLSAKGVVFYGAGNEQSVRALFGEKSFDTSRLALRGLVITGTEGAVTQGIALIEVDGKPAEAMSPGDMVPPGIRLEKISPDGVVLNYQGKEISLQQSFDNASGKTP
jgi:general secretion pathway protein C